MDLIQHSPTYTVLPKSTPPSTLKNSKDKQLKIMHHQGGALEECHTITDWLGEHKSSTRHPHVLALPAQRAELSALLDDSRLPFSRISLSSGDM